MRLSLDSLQVLDAIVRHGSFAQAAQALHRVPSAITYAVQKLEQDLDLQLFDRSGHRARLTEAGQRLLEDGRYLLAMAEDIERRAQQYAKGWEQELRIAVGDGLPFARLIPLIEEFDALGAETRLVFSREVRQGIWDALVDKRADLGLGAPGQLSPPGVYAALLFKVDTVLVVTAGHPLAGLRQPVDPLSLGQYRAILPGDTARLLPDSRCIVQPGQAVLRVPSLDEVEELVLAGLGIGSLTRSRAQPWLEQGRLVEVEVRDIMHRVSVNYIWRESHPGRALAWWLERLARVAERGDFAV